jgi:hypothetical protein
MTSVFKLHVLPWISHRGLILRFFLCTMPLAENVWALSQSILWSRGLYINCPAQKLPGNNTLPNNQMQKVSDCSSNSTYNGETCRPFPEDMVSVCSPYLRHRDRGPYSQSPRNFATKQIIYCLTHTLFTAWLPNKRLAWPQSCESFVDNMAMVLRNLVDSLEPHRQTKYLCRSKLDLLLLIFTLYVESLNQYLHCFSFGLSTRI